MLCFYYFTNNQFLAHLKSKSTQTNHLINKLYRQTSISPNTNPKTTNMICIHIIAKNASAVPKFKRYEYGA